ncbi:MAG: right-handed parallel beta-helix repeat-containing protein, partial [Burkholderiales bacterium]|nr:right-handed parallel beta-helix repeat-containing protein [Burkholderiales bacterium]
GILVEADKVTEQGNFLGVSSDASSAAANVDSGVKVTNASGAQIGGAALEHRNLVSSNGYTGVFFTQVSNSNIQGNLIGTDAAGVGGLANGSYGVQVATGGTGNRVGGTGAGEGNLISSTWATTITGSGTRVAVLGNVIRDTGNGLGIDLGNNAVTNNDANDVDTGANTLQNYPVLTSAASNGVSTVIAGTLNATANSWFRIEFFSSDTANNRGHGDAQVYLGFANVATDASGNASFTATLATGVAAGHVVTATATAADAGYGTFTATSEFSANVTAVAFGLTSNGGGASASIDVVENTTAVTTVAATGSGVTYAISGGADAARFAIDTSTGVLTFVAAPDFETPIDVGADNVYDVIVQASAGALTDTQAIAVTVTDVSSALVVTTAVDNNDAGIATGATYTAEWLNANKGADGFISLREAIIAANNTAGADGIAFNIAGAGVHTIGLTSALPTITDVLTIDGYTQPGTSVNTAAVGTNAVLLIELNGAGAGTDALGLSLQPGSAGSTIRGLVIDRFDGGGIWVGSNNATLAGNFIGTDPSGLVAQANGKTAAAVGGIRVNVASGATIGGAALSDRNLIAGNNYFDIYFSGGTNSTIRGNVIGANASATATLSTVPIAAVGFTNGSTGNVLGGAAAGQGNVIAGGRSNVVLTGGTSSQASILGNLMYGANAGSQMAIDLDNDGVTANDLGDADSGQNALQNFPVLTGAHTDGAGSATVTGTLNTSANTYLRVEFFAIASGSASSSGHGGAQRFLGYVNVLTDASGNASFGTTLPATLAEGEKVSATATVSNASYDAYAATSEFAANITATSALVLSSNGGGASASVSVPETTTAVTTVTATGAGLSYSIVGGPDAARFTIDSSSGALAFASAPDYETPTDSGANNTYDVIVQVANGAQFATQAIAVTVTDVSSALVVTATADNNDAGIVAGNAAETAEWLNAHKGADNAISLREALIAANNSPATTSVGFELTGVAGSFGEYAIHLASNLPVITKPVMIDGSTQPGTTAAGHPLVVIDGQGVAGYGFMFDNGSDGSTLKGLVIRDIAGTAVLVLPGSDGDTISGNYIGAYRADGSDGGSTLQNAGNGIQVQGANTTISGNLIGGNTAYGVYLLDGSDGSTVTGNLIGLNKTGTAAMASNGLAGILTAGSATNLTIGGTSGAARNVVSGHTLYGVWIGAAGSATVQGNYIGTDASGTLDLGNAFYGAIFTGGSVAFGGTAAGAGNLVSGNDQGGVYALNTSDVLPGNPVGLNAGGNAALANGGFGVRVSTVNASTIGGSAAGAGNTISGNNGPGLWLSSTPNPGHTVQGSFIGLGADHTTLLGNTGAGIRVEAGYARIGGGSAGQGNTIAGNGGAGVAVVHSYTGNLISANAIHANTGPGIDLGDDGATPNDPGDGDTGANFLNNTPVITSATTSSVTATVQGTYDTYPASQPISMQFFASSSAGTGGTGEGKRYLGSLSITPTGGIVAFTATGLAPVAIGEWITGTGTYGDYPGTSEFSLAVQATPSNAAPTLVPMAPVLTSITEDQTTNGGQTVASFAGASITEPDGTGLPYGIALTATTSGNGSWQYSTNGGTAWSAIGAVSGTSALLLRSTDLVRFVPDGLNGTTASLTSRAWDQTSGSAGNQVDAATSAGGDTAFSTATDTATLTVTAVNDAPVITSDGGGASSAVT